MTPVKEKTIELIKRMSDEQGGVCLQYLEQY
jgi:hypothetical protein